jgi:dihydrofolate reductase
LGKNNDLLWRIPDDLKRFKTLTSGHPVIMGRKTYESIGRPLPNRTNIVVTRDSGWEASGTVTAPSIEIAIEKAKSIDTQEVFVIGGGQVYTQALPYATRLYLTLIEEKIPVDADTFFPPYETEFTKVVSEERGSHEDTRYRWVTLERA